ncbi:glycosyltransferase family 4 protein [Thermoactinospora rubra]|uniref:glycosyltransferase family 4 protein n=1 Tax=Thermoactinospora rubra TaxID=1088767 RepID=UPI000A10AC06|nr:glycosyltransferase family 4 protein [Thermoactinospora rubra]
MQPLSPLRVAIVAPPWYDLPPHGYGGIEALVADLAGALVERGHDVTLIGAGKADTPGSFVATYPTAPSDRIGEPLPEILHAAAAAREIARLNPHIVHDHTLAGPLMAAARAVPTLVTVHGPVEGELGDYYRALGDTVYLAGISEAQRTHAPDLNWAGVVYNGIDVGTFPFRRDKEDWVLWLGRFTPDKGPDLAIEAARAADRRIVLAGKLTEDAERQYFAECVEPLLGPGVEYVGEADADRKRDLLARARCLVFPIQWEEPFGLVMVESMACGTPVVTLRRGSAPEVVEDGVTGFVLPDAAGMPEAIEAAGRLDPCACRAHVERRFDVPVMAEGYERLYHRVLDEATARRR